MLGLNGYEKNIELFELCLSNQCSEALKVYDDILQNGVQPLQIISNLLEISHLASKINVIKSDTNMTESIQKKISEISTNGLPKLVRLWQILIKSFEELKYAPNEEQAGSMAIIKLCYGSSLPDPSQFLEKISEQTNTQSENKQTKVSEASHSQDKLNKEVIVNNEEKSENFKNPESFEDMLDLLLKNKESLLHAQLINNVHLISFEESSIKLRLKFKSDTEILRNLSSTLEKITKNKWNVTHSEEDGEKTIVEKQNIKLNEQKEQIKANPHFAEVFKHFPQAEITSIEDKKSN
jgi:DNA polymerase-3 subunit gamma/tau